MSERQYIVKLPDGSESEPLFQSQLIEMANDNNLPAESQLRSTLVPRWVQAKSLPFLETIYEQQAEHAKKHPGILKKVTNRMTEKAERRQKFQFSLMQGRFHFTPAPVILRIMSGLTDTLLILAYSVIMASGYSIAVNFADTDPTLAAHIAVILTTIGIILYFTICIGVRAQTIGMWFWGLMIIGSTGKPVFMLRALCFSLSLMITGVLTPVVAFIMPGNRSIHDLATKTRIIRTRVTGGAA